MSAAATSGSRSARAVLRLALLASLGCSGAIDLEEDRDAAVPPAVDRDGAPERVDSGAPIAPREPWRPELAPNRWTLVRDDLPNIPWEVGIAYEPRTSTIYQHGGHLLSSYVQSSYTTLYSIRDDTFSEQLSPTRPQRRCIVELAFLDGPERLATVHGSAEHGTLPHGAIRDYRITRSDPRGPWLLDPVADRWEHARPSGSAWPQRVHSNVAYDATSDALYVVGGDALYAYVPHANRTMQLPIPAEVAGRSAYGMAFDPDTRRLVIFGGSQRSFTYGYIQGDESDNCDVVSAETCAMYYRDFVKDDTWVLDVDEAARAGWPAAASADVAPIGWRRIEGAHPPRGMPTWNHSRLQLHRQPSTGHLLLLQNPIDEAPIQSASEWPAIEMWDFDPESEVWARIETVDPPHYAGVAAYAAHEDALFVWGGGSVGDARASDGGAMTSRALYVIRPSIAGAELRAPVEIARAFVDSREDGSEVHFASRPGVEYEIARAAATPIAGAFDVVAQVLASGDETRWLDVEVDRDLETHAYRVRPVGALRWSLPAFDAPARPSRVRAIPLSDAEVAVAWDASLDDDVVAHRVYRWGPGEAHHAIADRVPGPGTSFVDRDVALGDGLARVYVVTAIDRAGRESGASPMAFTVPDAPVGLFVRELPDGRFQIDWTPDDPEHQRLEVHYLDFHCNARSTIETYLDTFALVPGGPFAGDRVVVTAPVIDPALRERAPLAEPGECGRTQRDGHFFYARVVNQLGQPGFYSDIVSPHDERFRAALARRP